jgi:hypothetical protein
MNYLTCIDDTDMPGTKGTGWLAQELCDAIKTNGLARETMAISRHQLYVHEDIPYTSHNSAMCFEMDISNGAIQPVIDFMGQFLETRSQKGSDPGLCVARLNNGVDTKSLMDFGADAKRRISSKEEAYSLAGRAGVHLSEHGGTGQGVIGAVAGVGLRLSGNDGRYRGWYHLGQPREVVCVDQLCAHPFIDCVVTPSGSPLSPDSRVVIGSEKTKTVRLDFRQVLVAVEVADAGLSGIPYRTITQEEAKNY